MTLAVAPLCRLRRLSLCSRCWRHIWLCWIVSCLQDPASLTISAMFVAFCRHGLHKTCRSLRYSWKHFSGLPYMSLKAAFPRVSTLHSPLAGSQEPKNSFFLLFWILNIWLYKQKHIYIISINISIYHIPSLVTGVWWCLMSRCRSFRFLSKQVS